MSACPVPCLNSATSQDDACQSLHVIHVIYIVVFLLLLSFNISLKCILFSGYCFEKSSHDSNLLAFVLHKWTIVDHARPS